MLKRADYSVIYNLAVDDEENRYSLPYYRKHAKPLDLAEAIVDNFRRYHSEKTRIESVGYQEMLREYVIKRSREENLFIPGLNIKENPATLNQTDWSPYNRSLLSVKCTFIKISKTLWMNCSYFKRKTR